MSVSSHQCDHRSCFCKVTGRKQYCCEECRDKAPDLSGCECEHEECEERASTGEGNEEAAPRKKKKLKDNLVSIPQAPSRTMSPRF